jgi:hypothetical protein
MFKTIATFGMLAMASLAIAGTAAAECDNGSLGLQTYDYYSVCALESYQYSYPPFYEYSGTDVVNAYYYGYEGGTDSGLGAYLGHYVGEQCWGSCSTYGGLNTGLYYYSYNWQQGEYTNFGLNAGQNYGEGNGWNYDSTYASLYVQGEGEYASLYYGQDSYNGNCYEYASVNSSVASESNYAPCVVDLEPVPALPSL